MNRFSILFCAFIPIMGVGQGFKNEKEVRLKKSEVPAILTNSFSAYQEKIKKIRYIRETDGDKKSYEAKLVIGKRRYNIEFSDNYILEDIEIDIAISEIPSNLYLKIKETLSTYEKYKVENVQKQLSSESKSKENQIREAFASQSGDLIRYELIVTCKEADQWNSYEMLFEENGELISQNKVVKRSTDFILY